MQTSETRSASPAAKSATAMATAAAKPVTSKAIAFEAMVACALALGTAALLSPADLGLGSLYPHPVWWAVALLATRYGSRGLAAGVVFGWGLAALGAMVWRAPLALVAARASSGCDLGALLGVVLIAWVASIHERRVAELAAAVTELEERGATDREALAGLRTTAVVLRARADRLETSLTFLRDVAERLGGTNRVQAAHAALELALARIGARAGLVAVVEGGSLVTIASNGPWQSAPDLKDDHTAAAALRNHRATRALDLSDAAMGDSDLAAPILGAQASLVGLIALYGVPQGGASAAALHDLALVAGWCAGSLASSRSAAALPFAEEVGDDEERGEEGEGNVLQLNL